MTPSRPYLIRALYQWIIDNQMTPHILVNAEHPRAEVPQQFVENGKIVLNIGPSAVQGLVAENDAVSFSARFSGHSMQIYVPTSAVLAIYARENGRGMVFSEEDDEPPAPETPDDDGTKKPALRLVK